MLKAKMKRDVLVGEIYESFEDTNEIDEIRTFKKGTIVEVLKSFEVIGSPYEYFVIFSEEINESTTVYSEILDFVFESENNNLLH